MKFLNRCVLRILLLFVTAGLAACPGDDGGDAGRNSPADEPQGSGLYTVSGAISGLTADALSVFLNADVDGDGTDDQRILIATGDGPFNFSTPLSDGTNYEVVVYATEDGSQRCGFGNPDVNVVEGKIDSANVTDIEIVCARGYEVSGTIRGLTGSGLTLDVEHGINRTSGGIRITGDRFAYHPLLDGESYSVEVTVQPSNPDQQCTVIDGSGTIAGADVTDVVVDCESATVGGIVSGLFGAGLEVALSLEVEINGNVQMLVIEHLPIEANGAFVFETRVPFDEPYLVGIYEQPRDPEQECTVENDEGIITGDVTDVTVRCPGPVRFYRYDDSDGLLKSGRQDFGALYDEHKFATGPAVPLGGVSGLEATPLFRTFLDRPGGDGAVYSNETGLTYWTVTESPQGQVDYGTGRLYPSSHYVTLKTVWSFRKKSPDARFQLVISKAEMIGYDDGHRLNGAASMSAGVQDLVLGYEILDRQPGPPTVTVPKSIPFYSSGGQMRLRAIRNPDDLNGPPLWEKQLLIDEDIEHETWTDDDFDLNNAAGIAISDPRRVAYMKLEHGILVDVDLSNIGVGTEILIISEAEAYAHNLFSNEGGMAAFFRDPGELDPGAAAQGVDVVEMSGLELLEVGEVAFDELVAHGGLPPTQCDPGTTDLAVLEFDAAAYEVAETPEAPYVPPIRILRNGNVAGLVSARISLTGGTADPVDDFVPDDKIVRFGDLSNAPRSLSEFVVDDDFDEGEETLTLTLHSPEGCAEIGAQNTASVTIVPSDPSPGTIVFSSDSYDIDESAGFASITVERVGGIAGTAAVTVSTADGSAAASLDYAPIAEQVVYQDGEDGPRTVEVPILNNGNDDGDRTVLLSLSSNDPVIVGVPNTATLTIVDDDVPGAGTLEFAEESYSVAEDAGSVTVAVARVGDSNGDVAVTVATSDGDAVAGEDYASVQAVVNFASGDTAPKTVEIAIVDDVEDEGDHGFSVMLFDPTGGAEIGTPGSVPVVIIDNDGAPPPLPAAPVLGVAAATNQLVFDWALVADASFYRMMMDADGLSGFSQIGNDIALGETRYRLPVSVHLMDWTDARFLLQACNSAGCTDSDAISAEAYMVGAIGFFKSSNSEGRQQVSSGSGDFFGWTVALSDDGNTLAATAYSEDSNAVYVNGDQSDNSLRDSGAVYVFTNDQSGWSQQAYVKAPNTDSGDRFGAALAVSADGNTLAIGAPNEGSNAVGIDGDHSDNSMLASGAVYVYTRDSDVWSLQAYLKASNTDSGDLFGTGVALSDDGNTLIVGAPEEASGAVGLDGDQTDNGIVEAGAAYLFVRSGATWTQAAYVKASNTEAVDWFGSSVGISGDGLTFAVAAWHEDSAARGINGDQDDNTAAGSGHSSAGTGAVYVFANIGGGWSQQAYVKSSNLDPDDRFGSAVSFGQDGNTMAIAAMAEDSVGTGVNSPAENDNAEENSGAVYLFSRSGGVWQQDSYIKASNPGRNHRFGRALELSGDGQYLIVGADGEDSKAVGINGDQSQSINIDIGAAYLFRRDPVGGSWSQLSYIKASNSDQDRFGYGRELSFGQIVSISGDGDTLAIGAYRDGSDATGINGDQVNEDALQSGAVYVY